MRFVYERELPGFDPGIDVEVLFSSDRYLTRVAKQLEIIPLNDFYSSFPAGEIDDADEYGAAGEEDWRIWNEPGEGLETVSPLIQYLEEHPEDPEITPAILENLKRLKKALSESKEHNIKWTLEVY